MSGFFIDIGMITEDYKVPSVAKDTVIEPEFFASHQMLEKFSNDRIFINKNKYFIILDGIVLNKVELQKCYSGTWEGTILNLYNKKGDTFFNEFRGSFCGVLYNKITKKWIIFSDQIGSKHIFYTIINDNLVVSADIAIIYKYFKINNIQYSLNKHAAYMFLSYGFMLEEFTLCNEVKRLLPGYYLEYSSGELVQLKRYYAIDNTPVERTEKEYINLIDKYFRLAIHRQFEKDKEYGYRHFVELSGGLDSRMTSIVAHDMGYVEQVNFTLSQTNYLDETIAKSIASDYNHEWIFIPLDSGNHLQNIEKVIKINGGNSIFFAQSRMYFGYNSIKMTDFGLNHSGQLGDVILGTYNSTRNQNECWELGSGSVLKDYVNNINVSLKIEYKNYDQFMLYNRGFVGINNGLIVRQKFTETMSPFYDVDFMSIALSIPIKYRFNHHIYKKWIIEKYPKAANYLWEKTNDKITSTPFIRYKYKKYTIKHFTKKVVEEVKKNIGLKSYVKEMNPVDNWFKTNLQIKIFFDDYFAENLNTVQNKKLKMDLVYIYNNYGNIEKLYAVSLLAALKLFFKE